MARATNRINQGNGREILESFIPDGMNQFKIPSIRIEHCIIRDLQMVNEYLQTQKPATRLPTNASP
jgi:hypothetical protein